MNEHEITGQLLDIMFCVSPLLGGWLVHVIMTRVLAKKSGYI